MIRFIQLTNQILSTTNEDEYHFAWYDTVTDRFVTTSDLQSQTFDFDTLVEELLDKDSPIRQKRDLISLFILLPESIKIRIRKEYPIIIPGL